MNVLTCSYCRKPAFSREELSRHLTVEHSSFSRYRTPADPVFLTRDPGWSKRRLVFPTHVSFGKKR